MAHPTVAVNELSVQGARLKLRHAGRGRPILYLHDELSSEWNPFLDRLSEEFQVFAPDIPGFGGSERPEWLDTVEDAAFFLADVVDALQVDSPIGVVAAGLGGWLALEMALRSVDRFEGLVLIGSPGLEIEGDAPVDYFLLTPQERVALFFNDPACAPTVDEESMIRNEMMTARLAWQPRYVSPKLGVRVHRLKTRALVAWGRDDRFLSLEHGRALARSLPNAELVVMEGTGHFPALERPDETARVVTEFMSRG